MSVIPESELTNVNFLMAPLPFDPATATRVILFVAPYDMFIDEAAIRYTVANGAALTGNISKLADGTAVSSAGTALTSAVDMDSTADTVLFSLGLKTDIDANRASRGDAILLEFSGAAAAALGLVSVTIRGHREFG